MPQILKHRVALEVCVEGGRAAFAYYRNGETDASCPRVGGGPGFQSSGRYLRLNKTTNM
jgi:hypothetical protein